MHTYISVHTDTCIHAFNPVDLCNMSLSLNSINARAILRIQMRHDMLVFAYAAHLCTTFSCVPSDFCAMQVFLIRFHSICRFSFIDVASYVDLRNEI